MPPSLFRLIPVPKGMIYRTAQEWLNAPRKKVAFFGMSGLGKTYLSNLLRHRGGWFHYSIDYRIGTRYMGEAITDNAKRLAMTEPTLRKLLRSDSIYIGSNISFENLEPLSVYLGQPGDAAKGGLPMDEYQRRQDEHQVAERRALMDTGWFSHRAHDLYQYDNFVCDTGGSICEVVDPEDDNDPIMQHLRQETLMIWLKGDPSHTDELIARFERAPKPMCYRNEVLAQAWADYLAQEGCAPQDVDPNAFATFAYARAITNRAPRYAAMARHGITLTQEDVRAVKTPEDFTDLIAQKLDAR